MLIRRPSDGERAALREAEDDRPLRLFHRARGLRGLTPEQVGRIASRLDALVGPGAPSRRRSLVPVLVTLALLLFAGTALALATVTLQRLPGVRALVAPRPTPPPHGERPSRPFGRPSLPSSEAVAPPWPSRIAEVDAEVAGPPSPIVPHQPLVAGSGTRSSRAAPAAREHDKRDRVAVHPASPAGASPEALGAPAPAPAESPVAREGESLANVLRTWRREHDGGAALAALDLHERRFADGQMELEARLLRVEILLSAGRDQQALAILDALPIGGVAVPRGRELLTMRGELRIKAGRCEEGRADLAAIHGGADGLAERARNALTHCR